jgi:hypothetical protein
MPGYIDVKSALRMELVLNLVWFALAMAVFCLSPRVVTPATYSRCVQFAALTVLTLILFPVISITDDLLAAQNPAEADCCLRKDHEVSNAHSIIPAVVALPPTAFAGVFFSSHRLDAPRGPAIPTVDHPGLATVQNRPPPAA